MLTDIKLSIPEDCGNAPKKQILRDFNVAFVTKDNTFLHGILSVTKLLKVKRILLINCLGYKKR